MEAETTLEIKKLKDEFGDCGRYELRDKLQRRVTNSSRYKLEKRLALMNRLESTRLSIERMSYLVRKRGAIHSESGIVDAKVSDGAISLPETNETLLDVLGGELTYVSAGKSSNSNQGQENLLSVANFLSRPAIIHSDTHAVGTSIEEVLSVWDLFTSLPAVRAKIRNYAFLRGDLKVRISISGTPFHAGRLLVSYQPNAFINRNLLKLGNAVIISATYKQCLLNYLSQARGSITMNVNENKPVELVFPFISTKPMHRLYNKDVTPPIADTESFDDMKYAGDLYLYSTSTIKAAGTGDTPIFVQVYAWMENVQLGTNTGTVLQITSESGAASEMKTGPIQTITSRLLKVSRALEKVGFLGSYATASTLLLSGANRVATIMGWSKPVKTSDVNRVKLEQFANMALTIGNDNAQRIVIDPLQELNIDGQCVGTDTDEMVISTLACRRSLVESFAWAAADDAMSTLLFTCAVTPNLVTTRNVVPTRLYQPSAMAFAVLPFEYWRGDIIFRFEVVCTQFHRGKLAILYEPNLSHFSSIGADIKINKQYIRVIDIQDTNTFELRVNWASYRAWLKVGTAANAYQNIDIALTSLGNGYANGGIVVTPFTDLQSPDASSVTVNVYVYSDNLQVNGLTGANLPNARATFADPGFAEIKSESGEVAAITTLDVTQLDLNPSSASANHICEEHFGEQPLSFRGLLKRYVTTRKIAVTDALTTNRLATYTFNIFPPSGLDFGGSGYMTELFTYLRYAYLGWKGSIRTVVSTNSLPTIGGLALGRITMLPPSTSVTDGLAVDTTTYNSSYLEGTVSSGSITGPSLHCETPFYSNNLFVYPLSETLDDGLASLDMMEHEWFRGAKVSFCMASSAAVASSKIVIDQAAGEDFTFLRFLGAPYYTMVIA